ncbi:MAG: PAS domain S-box protein [Salinivirgaceae bacterium]|nr:PAS domain S-box protein [Salinivirgaceae bacterium]
MKDKITTLHKVIIVLSAVLTCVLILGLVLAAIGVEPVGGVFVIGVAAFLAALVISVTLFFIFRHKLREGALANILRREANLQAHTKELQAVLQNISEALITVDRNGNIWSVNDVAMQLTGFNRNQIVGHNIVSIFNISDKDGTKLDHLVADVLKGHEKILLPEGTMLTRKDGKQVPVKGTFSPMKNELNLMTGFVVTFNDNSDAYYKRQLLEQGVDSYQRIFNCNPHPMCIYDLDEFNVQMTNQAVSDILGYSVEKVLNTSIFNYVPSQFATMMKTADPILQKKIQNDNRCYLINKEGVPVCMQKSSFSIKFNGKQCRYVLFSELPDEKLAADISSLQRRYKQMMDSTPEAILVHNLEDKITYVNQFCVKLFGATGPEQLVGRHIKTIYAEGVFDSIRAQIIKLTTRQKSSEEAVRDMVRLDGSHFLASIVGTSFVMNGEMYVQVLIKERLDNEEAVAATNSDFRNLTDIGDLQIWKFDITGNIVFANTALKYFVGDTGKLYLHGGEWRNLIHPEERDSRLNAGKQLMARYEDLQTEVRLLCGNGSYYWFYVCATPNFDSTGKCIGYIGYNININRRKLAEIEMEKAKKQAEESLRLKSSFLSILSHEIRTPMNAIIGFTDLLKMNSTPENTAKYIDIIQRNGYNLLSIITNTVEASKIDSNQISVNNEKFDIKQLADEVFSDSQLRNDNNLVMTHNNQLPPKMIIVSDKFKIRQLLNYVLDNALKYTPSGSVTMESVLRDDKMVFTIVDTGIGVAEVDKERIFKKFYRVDNNSTIQSRGAGLGLHITQAYVKVLGGTIKFDSSVDVGSMVTIEIPCVKEESELLARATDSGLFSKQKSIVLVAEDDEFNAIYISTILEGAGYQVRLAYDGEAAVKAVHEEPDIKLVLMDLQMPIIDGFEALNQIRQFNTDIPVIAQTCFALSDFRYKMKDNDFADVMYKPLQKDRLLEIVGKYMGGNDNSNTDADTNANTNTDTNTNTNTDANADTDTNGVINDK